MFLWDSFTMWRYSKSTVWVCVGVWFCFVWVFSILLLYCLLVCIVSSESSTFIFIFIPLYERLFTSVFKIFSSLLVLSNLIMMCSGVVFVSYSFTWGSLSSLDLRICSFHQIWGNFGHYFFKDFFCPIFKVLNYLYLRLLAFVPQLVDLILFGGSFSPYVSFWILPITKLSY